MEAQTWQPCYCPSKARLCEPWVGEVLAGGHGPGLEGALGQGLFSLPTAQLLQPCPDSSSPFAVPSRVLPLPPRGSESASKD